LVISKLSHAPVTSKISTLMPSWNPHSSSPIGQLFCGFTLISAETFGIGSAMVVCAEVFGT